MSEPKRPPPPKSYVPLLLLDDGPTPELPPRPVIDDSGDGSAVPRPTPQPRSSPAPVDLLLMGDNEPSLLISTAPLDPTPALLPLTEEGPKPVQDGMAVDREDSASPVPLKPERRKKKGPPPVPAPYAGPKKVASEVSPPSSEPHASGPTAAARRHTMAGTRPMRPRPPPISPQAHESHEAPSSSSSSSKGSKQTPTTPSSSIISPNEQKSIYASVKKPKRYPAPTMPAPPPPYEGDTIKKMASVESPSTPNPPSTVSANEPPLPPVTKESGQGHPTRLQPPLEERDGGSAKVTGGSGDGKEGTVPGRPRPPRPAPSRPSRPPAVSPSPAPESPSPVPPVTRPQKQPSGVTASNSPEPSRRLTANKMKSGAKPEITIVSAQPMVGDTIPSPTDIVTSPKYDHPTPRGQPPVPAPPTRPPPASAPRKPAPPQPRRPPPATATATSNPPGPLSPTSPAAGETGGRPQPKKRKEQEPPPTSSEAKIDKESAEQNKKEEKEKEEVDSAVIGPTSKSPPAPAPPRQPAKRPPPPRKLPEKKPPITAAVQQDTDQHTGAEGKPPAPAAIPEHEVHAVPPAAAPVAVTAVTKPAQRPSRPSQIRKPPPLPQSRPAAESPDIAKKLQQIGPPPDEEPPEIPTDELMEVEDDTNLAGDENQSNGKGSPGEMPSAEPVEVSEAVPIPAPTKPERKTKQTPTPTERTAPKAKVESESTSKGEEHEQGDTTSEPQASKSTRAPPRRPPTVKRPPPPSKKASTDIKPDDAIEAAEPPPVSEDQAQGEQRQGEEQKEKPSQPPKRPSIVKRPPPPSKKASTDVKPADANKAMEPPLVGEEKPSEEDQTEEQREGEEEKEKSQPPKRPSMVKRPPPPTLRPVPRQRDTPKTPEAQEQAEQVLSPKEEVLQSPTNRKQGVEKMEVSESVQAESRPTATKRLPSVSRPPPPGKRPHPQTATAAEIDKQENTEGQVADAPPENEFKHDTEEEKVSPVTSPKQDKPTSHSPGPKRPRPPSIKKKKAADEPADINEEKPNQPPPQPQPVTKKPSIKRPPPPAMPKKQPQVKPAQQEVKPAESDKIEDMASEEPIKEEKAEKILADSQGESESKEQEVSEKKPAQRSPGPKRPAAPLSKRLSVEKPPTKPTQRETEPVEKESREEEVASEKEERSSEDKSTEPQVKLSVDSKHELKEQEVVDEKPAQHSPGPKRPAPPSTKKLSIKKPPPPAAARKPSVKSKQPAPPVIKKDERVESKTVAQEDKNVIQTGDQAAPKPSEELAKDKAKEAQPVIVESVEKVEADQGEKEVTSTQPSRISSNESTEKMTMTVLMQPGRKSPNMGRKSPTLRKKSRQGQESDEEMEGSVKIIKYSSGSSLTRNGINGKAGEAEEVKLRSKPSKAKPSRPVSMPPARPPGSPSLRKAPKQTSAVKINEEKPPPPSIPLPPRPKPAKPTRPPPAAMKPSKPPAPSKHTAPSKPAAGPSRPAAGVSRPPAATQRTAISKKQEPSGPPPFPPRPGPGHPLYRYTCTEPHGIANSHYDTTAEDELPFMEGDVIELIEKVDDYWFFARNADLDMHEGLILASNLNIVKRLPGQDKVAGFEEGPCAVALHDFDAQDMDELSLKAGDLIMLKSRVGSDWLRGRTINGREGIFPKSFVEVVEDLPPDAVEEVAPPAQHTASQSTSDIREPHCVALYDFDADGPGELSIRTNDVILLVEMVDADWIKGRLKGQEGIFPSGFVEIKVALPPKSKTTSAPPPTPKAGAGGGGGGATLSTALFDFDGQEGELSFKTGDKIKVTYQVDADWVVGELRGKKGMFPASFVDKVPENLPTQDSSKEESESPSRSGGSGGQPSSQATATKKQETGKCEATFDFDGDVGAGELRFTTGEVIETTKWINEEWMSGRIGSREGIFPMVFVKVIKDLPKQTSTTTTVTTVKKTSQLSDDLLPKGVALYDFTAGNDEEISFKEGDTLNLLDRIGDSWFMGENTRTGAIGNFPVNFVDVITPLP